MSRQFEAWRKELNRFPHGDAEFQKWLFIRISAVLFGGKGGELLMLSAGKCTLTIDQQMRCIEALSPAWQYFYAVLLRGDARRAQVVIYNPSAVRKALREVPRPAFDRMGYSRALDPKEFLGEVGRRWRRKGKIPHEIGLALGYPVKDVLGFIGLVSLECSGTCGWRIYGDPEPSMRARLRYTQARAEARAFLDKGSKPVQSGTERR